VDVAGVLIVASPTWSPAEVRVVQAVHGAPNAVFDIVALTINTVCGPAGAVLIVAISLGWAFLLTRSWRRPLLILVVVAVPWAIAETLKSVVRRPRPDGSLLSPEVIPDPSTFSYPSGHTAFAAALSCALILVLTDTGSRTIPVIAGSVLVAVTAWSRVYLGVHYPTDVAASMLLVPVTAVALHRLLTRLAWFDSPFSGPPVAATNPHG
jgi:undecaprenyl-diphosphatase